MRRSIIPLALVLTSLLLAMLPAKASPDVYTDDSFSSPGGLDGTEVVGGNVRLRIVPENWWQTNWSGDNGQSVWDPNQPTRYYDNENVDGRGSPGIVWLMKKVSDNWTQLTDAPLSGDWGMWTIGVGENVWILKGGTSDSPTLARYNPVEGWSNFGDLTITWQETKQWLKNGCAMIWDNREYIYVLAGGAYADYPGTTTAGGEPRYGFWRFSVNDPSTWVRLENTPWWHGAGDFMAWVRVGSENYIYAWLGTTSRNSGAKPAYAKFYRYHITPSAPDGIGQWETTPITEIPEKGVSSYPYGSDDGNGLVWTGGDNIYFSPGAYDEGYSGKEYYWGRFIISENRWERLESMPYNVNPGTTEEDGVDDGGSLAYDGKDFIYALKGGDGSGGVAADNFWRYRISTNAWEVLAGVSRGVGERNGARLAATTDGKIYVWIGYGGVPGINSGPSNEFWRYNPPTYKDNGWLESSVFDAGVTSTWQTINWSASSPAGALNKKKTVSAEPDNLVDGENRLGICFTENEYGNGFVINASPRSADVKAADERASWRFVAQANKTVTRIRGYFKEAGTSPSYTVRLENDNNGYPSGTLAWAGAENTLSITASGWVTFDIPDGAVTENAVYHIVLVPGTVAPDSDNYIGLRYTRPLNPKWINGVTTNDNRNTLFYDGEDWSVLDAEPVYILDYSDDTYEGNPYYTYGLKKVYADNYYGEQFTPSSAITVTKISFYTARRYAPPDSLYVELATTTAVIENGSLGSAATIGTDFSWYSYTFSTPRTLSADTTYRVYLKSPGATADNYYKVWALDTYIGAPYENLTYDNTNSVLCKYASGAWSTEKDEDVSFVFTTRVAAATAYGDTQSRDRIYEEISEENTVQVQTWTQTNWSGGAKGVTPPPVVTGTTDNYARGENENAADGENIKLAGFFWEGRASILAYGRGVSAVYAENSDNKYIYAVRGSANCDFYRYKIDTNTWENITAAVPATLLFDDGAALVWTGGDNIYALRGDGTDNFYRYSVSNDTWTALAGFAPLATDSSSMVWTGDDNIYLVTEGVDNLWRYSIAGNSWSIAHADLPALPTDSPALVWTGGDNIYINLGGSTAFRRYSISDNTFTSLKGLPLATGSGASMAQVGSYIYCARGAGSMEFYQYDIGANSWENIRPLPDTVGTNDGNRLVRFENSLYMVRGVSTTAFWRFALYLPSGYLESSILDAGEKVVWGTISFDNLTPAGTGLVVKARVSDNDNNPYDGAENWSAWQTFSSGVDLPYENRYFQYQVELSTTDNNLTPTFKEVSVTYSAYKYALRWEHRITGVENTYENVKLRIYGYNVTGDENVGVYIWRQVAPSGWVFIDNLDNGSAGWVENAVDNVNRYLVGENISIKFESADNTDATRTTIFIDYVVLEAQKPYSTSVRVWTSSSSDNSTWSGWLENASGDSLPHENRYIRYRVRLSTTDGEVTPMLHELRIAYVTKTPRSGTFTSQPLELGYVDSWGTLGWQASTPSGTSISFATRSSEDGANWHDWQELGSSSIQSPTYGLRYLQVKATLYGLGVTSPTLYGYSIDYSPDRTPPSITLSEPRDGFLTGESHITLRGEISDKNPFTLKVNGQAVFAPGSFSTEVWLDDGPNVISLTARDVAGNESTLTIRGTRVVPSPPVTPSGPSTEQVAVVAAVATAGVAALAAWAFLRGPLHHSSGSFGQRHR